MSTIAALNQDIATGVGVGVVVLLIICCGLTKWKQLRDSKIRLLVNHEIDMLGSSGRALREAKEKEEREKRYKSKVSNNNSTVLKVNRKQTIDTSEDQYETIEIRGHVSVEEGIRRLERRPSKTSSPTTPKTPSSERRRSFSNEPSALVKEDDKDNDKRRKSFSGSPIEISPERRGSKQSFSAVPTSPSSNYSIVEDKKKIKFGGEMKKANSDASTTQHRFSVSASDLNKRKSEMKTVSKNSYL